VRRASSDELRFKNIYEQRWNGVTQSVVPSIRCNVLGQVTSEAVTMGGDDDKGTNSEIYDHGDWATPSMSANKLPGWADCDSALDLGLNTKVENLPSEKHSAG